jgi:glycerol uptake facilitator-like aquaporin
MCPPPTYQITVALVTGFAAATATGASFSSSPKASGNILDDADHSGGFISLSVTLSQALRGHIPLVRCLTYTAAQLAGACLGAALLVGVLSDGCVSAVYAYAASISAHGGVDASSLVLLNGSLNAGLALTHLLCRRLNSMATPGA